MDAASLLSQLEALAHKLGMEVRYESFGDDMEDRPGGCCRIGYKHLIIVNSRLPIEHQVKVVGKALNHYDLDGVYMRPAVREFLSSVSQLLSNSDEITQ